MSTLAEPIIKHKGMADPSASIGLSNGRFLTAGDEFNLFQVYDANKKGKWLEELDFSSFVNTKHPNKEADIEGCAKAGNLVYWISSHGRNGHGELKWRRHQLFATHIKDHGDRTTIKQVGISYTGLLTDLLQLSWFRKLTHERLDPEPDKTLSAKSRGAVNIEGLSASPNGLYIGFRNPLYEGKAVVVELQNPEDVVTNGEHAVFGSPIYLDLNGRGIRSLDYWPERNLYIVSSGSYDAVKDFEFFTWAPDERNSSPKKIDIGSLDGLNPESIVTFDGDASNVLIISDDGAEEAPGDNSPNKDKDPEEQTFRTFWVKI